MHLSTTDFLFAVGRFSNILFCFNLKFFQSFRESFPRVYFLLQGEAVCVHRAREGGSKPSCDLLCAWGGHTLFRRMQTTRLMDCQSVRFPGFIFIREIVTQPLGEAEERAGLLFCSGLLSPGSRMRWRGSEFSCLGRALRRGGVNLQQQLSPLQTLRDVHKGHIWCNQKHTLLVSSKLNEILSSNTFTFTRVVCHQWPAVSGSNLQHDYEPLLGVSSKFHLSEWM